MKLFTLKDSAYICDSDFDYTIHRAQVLDVVNNEYEIFNFGLIESSGKRISMKHGAIITSIPSEVVELDRDYIMLKYKKDDIFCKGTKTVMDSSFVEIYFNLLLTGRLINKIPYLDHREIRENVLNKNKRINVPMIHFDIFMASLIKDKSDPRIDHRCKPDGEYITMNTRELVSISAGTMGSATFEDPAAMTLINVTRKEKEENTSILEEYMLL